ncbi:peroxiredoxin [Nocardiopsis sp. RSe5-2]|uniref:thioredoxin-dependent peroxiredoxin n=1 Tax=Nocardiopsis endophytica TaxID=3018445 RepID=A0ABT4U4W3_9ACTN|nr:peroxiredoxin [Nocardiopsis endophytica]MDA2811988.1 peroxiredoxin [Nocardiopsis endophytica]
MVDIGDTAPGFSLPDQNGRVRDLDGLLAQGPLALFFYPAAMTPGCTAESCRFRDLSEEFARIGAGCAGISADAVERQSAFAGMHGFGFPLLSDADGTVARAYGVRRAAPGLSALAPTRRCTFVIGADRRILHVVRSEIRMNAHADGALAALRKADGAGAAGG